MGVEGFQGLAHEAMQAFAVHAQQRTVGRVLDQGVAEAIGRIGGRIMNIDKPDLHQA